MIFLTKYYLTFMRKGVDKYTCHDIIVLTRILVNIMLGGSL